MRPVDRGDWPKSGGVNVVFTEYGDARRWLYDRLGHYCSYCNRRLESAAVEHVRPKSHHPASETDWENFLLACVNCNSHKGSFDVNLGDYFWPDRDNTMRAFAYHESGRVSVAPALVGTALECIASRTLALTGLDCVPKLDPGGEVPTPNTDPKAADLRYERRRAVWAMALDARNDLLQNPSPHTQRLVLTAVREAGYWPIWYVNLCDLPGMRDALIAAVPNTSELCFDATGAPIPRTGGQL